MPSPAIVVVEPQDALKAWLCTRIRYVPTKNMTCVGLWHSVKKELLWVVGYDHWSSASCEIHVAGEGFVSREFLYKVFSYPFLSAGVKVLVAKVSTGNPEALRLDKHLGFKEMCTIPHAAPDGDIVVLAMQREECRWLKLGQEKREVA